MSAQLPLSAAVRLHVPNSEFESGINAANWCTVEEDLARDGFSARTCPQLQPTAP
jgi:hypothetical protein